MVSIVMTALVCSGCADVVSNGGGSGGSSGAGGTSVGCNLDNREPNDLFDDKTGIGSGTVHGTCQSVGDQAACTGPDQRDDWSLFVDEDGTHKIELTWSNATSDLSLALLGVLTESTCEILEAGVRGDGPEQTIEVFLDRGAQVTAVVLAIDTNDLAEPYELWYTIVQ